MDEDTLGLGALSNLGFNFSPMALLGGFVFGVVGFYYWREGKRRQYVRTKYAGLALMLYPLAVSNTVLIWCMGVFLWSLAYYFKTDGQ